MRYATTDDAVEKIMKLGQDCQLAKVDVEHEHPDPCGRSLTTKNAVEGGHLY